MLVAITAQGKIYAFEPAIGQVRWTRTGNAFGIDTSNEETLYIAEAGKLSTVNLKTGTTQWITETPFASSAKTFTVVKNRIFAPIGVADTYSNQIEIYSTKTGKRLGEASRSPLAILNDKFFSQDNWVLVDYPDEIYLNVYSLEAGKPLERRTYTVENRVKGQNWTSKVAIDPKAIYISGGSNLACFLLDSPARKGKPDFTRVPEGEVTWIAGPHRRTFVLEWQEAVWFVRRHQNRPCSPVSLLEQGQKLGSGRVANITFAKNYIYIGLKNGMFYAVDTQFGETVLRLELHTSAFGPTRTAGNRLIIQAADELRAFRLP